VKGLVKIVLAGFLGFMVLAMAQEWDVFHSAWFGGTPPDRQLATDEQKQAADVVHLMLTVMSHLYASGGDVRFAERLPAAQGVIDEMLVDIDYLARNHRLQEMTLDRLEIVSVERSGEGRLEVHTRERWQVRFLGTDGEGEVDPPLRQTAHGKYLLVKSGRGWRVEGWEVETT